MAPIVNYALALAMPVLSMAAAFPNEVSERGSNQFEASAIVGGQTVHPGEFPYIVSLSHNNSHFCGGILLNAYTVITAAHCTIDYNATDVQVRAGTLTWASGGTQVNVSELAMHPEYDAVTTDHDLALWHLATAIPESKTISYGVLPAQDAEPAAGTILTTAGWGYRSWTHYHVQEKLRKVSVPVVSRAKCQTEYAAFHNVTENMICAGLDAGGKDACSGDSGGPIVDAVSGRLVGLVSWGEACATPGYAGVYTNVAQFANYIKKGLWTSI
ncbi:hypothetical protein NHQ30_006835 [Ciborinia camelliae]|nr:hypothetical protein NHQ30_006835 [Ciborinia camelliae]